jgi:hypothetical protein
MIQNKHIIPQLFIFSMHVGVEKKGCCIQSTKKNYKLMN